MTGQKPRSTSLLRRTRHWTTFACVTAWLAGIMTLWAGHPIHGALMLVAALVLVKSSVFGRRRKSTRAHSTQTSTAVAQHHPGQARKLRKAA